MTYFAFAETIENQLAACTRDGARLPNVAKAAGFRTWRGRDAVMQIRCWKGRFATLMRQPEARWLTRPSALADPNPGQVDAVAAGNTAGSAAEADCAGMRVAISAMAVAGRAGPNR